MSNTTQPSKEIKDRLNKLFLTLDKAHNDATEIIHANGLLDWAEDEMQTPTTEENTQMAENILDFYDRFSI